MFGVNGTAIEMTKEPISKRMQRRLYLKSLARKNIVIVAFTPVFQSYYSAGDEAEPFCPHCEDELEDGWAYCPTCGKGLLWPEEVRLDLV